MASLFVVLSAADSTIELPEATLQRVRAAMQERRPGVIRELRGSGFTCLVGGDDASTVNGEDLLFVADGGPRLTSDSRPSSRLVTEWRRDPAPVLDTLDGSFALVVVDGASGEIHLVRDRFGTRPLFWVEQDDRIVVASECKILAAFGIPLSLDRRGLEESLLGRWLVGDRHILAPIRQVPAASTVRWRKGRTEGARRYWTLDFEPGRPGPDALEHHGDRTRVALAESVARVAGGRRRIGVLLSGGIDSSVIAAVAREVVDECVGFIGSIPGAPDEELARARFVARALGIELRVVPIAAPDYRADLRAMLWRLEEPPRHPNNAVLEQLYARAADEVDIVLHGDGAEMLFGLSDVRRVARFRRKRRWVRLIPEGVRQAVARTLRTFDDDRLRRLARVLAWNDTTYAARLDTIEYSPPVARILRGAIGDGAPEFLPAEWFTRLADFSDALQAYQTYTFLASSLVRHDRLAQPLGLTSVSPFLEGPMVECSRRLPRELRYTDGPKPVLRALCDRDLPAEVSRWPKLGFPVPWQAWLRDAMPEGPGVSDGVVRALPPGLVDAAVEADDAEAFWTVASIGALVDLFDATPPPFNVPAPSALPSTPARRSARRS